MKKVLIASLIVVLVISSCKFIRTKILSKKVDTLSSFVDTLNQAEQIDSSIYQQMVTGVQQEAQAEVNAVQNETSSATDVQFFMIVGCFKVPENASKYAEKIRGMGYEGDIISGYGSYQMVTAKSYNNFRTSIADIDQFRSDITPNAWVYVKK